MPRVYPTALLVVALIGAQLSCVDAQDSSSEPYRYLSLKEASDAEVFRFMSAGKSEFDVEREAKGPDRLPSDFWTTDPRSAAVALLEANRTNEHRAAYRLLATNQDNAAPPEHCTITFSNF